MTATATSTSIARLAVRGTLTTAEGIVTKTYPARDAEKAAEILRDFHEAQERQHLTADAEIIRLGTVAAALAAPAATKFFAALGYR
ncbi:hypothetical protein ACLQ2R_03085 [Streptosporangium sp. DT93]|uniref:hypothetical protein n=1 Tax=Streptosporangium sp. DT93 TaxID=3393428 RepID=UPI003CF364EC